MDPKKPVSSHEPGPSLCSWFSTQTQNIVFLLPRLHNEIALNRVIVQNHETGLCQGKGQAPNSSITKYTMSTHSYSYSSPTSNKSNHTSPYEFETCYFPFQSPQTQISPTIPNSHHSSDPHLPLYYPSPAEFPKSVSRISPSPRSRFLSSSTRGAG